jgi:hypothetical protein
LFKLDETVVCDDGIASEEDEETEEDCEESEIVCPTTGAPKGPLRVLDRVLAGVGVVEGVVEVRITGIPEVSGCPDCGCLLGRAEWFFCVRLLGDTTEAWAGERLPRLLGLELERGLASAVIGRCSWGNIQHKGRNHRQCGL